MNRRYGKDVQKPVLRRSMDFAYENIVAESPVSLFDRDNELHVFEGFPKSLSGLDSLRSLSTHDSFLQVENTFNILDCTFDRVDLKSIDEEETFAAELKWITFSEHFGDRNGLTPRSVSSSKHPPETSTGVFAPCIF